MKQFVTAARGKSGTAKRDEATAVEFEIVDPDGDVFQAKIYEPSTAQGAILASLSKRANRRNAEALSSFISLFFEICDPDTALYLERRLIDSDDPFDIEATTEVDDEGEEIVCAGLLDIFEYVMGEWSARPTKSQSGSQKRRSGTGKASTAPTRVKGSTSSNSRSRASSQ